MKNFPNLNIVFVLSFFIVVCISSISLAAIYEYTDDNGKTYYTDNKNNIPEKYRKTNKDTKVFLETDSLSASEIKTQTQNLQKHTQKKITKKKKSIMVEDKKVAEKNIQKSFNNTPKISPKKITPQESIQIKTPKDKVRSIRKGSGY